MDEKPWGKKKMINDFRDEIMMTLNFWRDCHNLPLDEEMEKALKELESKRGKDNVFYLTTLKNRFIVLYEKDKWKELITEYIGLKEKLQKKKMYSNKDLAFFHYAACLSYLELNKRREAENCLK